MDLVPRYRFERLVREALDDLPDELVHVLDNVVVRVEDENPDEPEILGLYDGTPHTRAHRPGGTRRRVDLSAPAVRDVR